eukprot:GDKI01042568.1.p1 GENE.GDKI01042568.1~~GDKI01042568.1.p1  ORF type:complete len:346 (-),score=78.66 GDKI01042568.1:94-1131(-)
MEEAFFSKQMENLHAMYARHQQEMLSEIEMLKAHMEQEKEALEKAKSEFTREMERREGEFRCVCEKQKEELKGEWEKLEREREKMMDVQAKQSDIIELNIGGRLFITTRATLCAQPDTLLASMFSGRWEGNLRRDESGAVVLCFNPDLFTILIDHLSAVERSPGDTKFPSPSLSREQKETWSHMITYLGFVPAIHMAALDRFSVKDSHGFTLSQGGRRGMKTGDGGECVYLIGEGSVGMGETHTWRIKAIGDGIHIGVVSDEVHPSRWVGFNFEGYVKGPINSCYTPPIDDFVPKAISHGDTVIDTEWGIPKLELHYNTYSEVHLPNWERGKGAGEKLWGRNCVC